MEYLWFLLGVIFGSIVVCFLYFKRTESGTLRIDQSDPEKDVYRLDIKNLDDLSKKKRIVLKVDPYADLSQK